MLRHRDTHTYTEEMLYKLIGNVAGDLGDDLLVHSGAEGMFSSNNVSKKSDRPAHALHVLVHCQLALQRADLALLGADLLQLCEHVLGHAVLHHTRRFGMAV